MRKVIRTDDKGFKRVVMLRDSDPDSLARAGIPVSLPVDDLDWNAIKRDLNNILIERGIFTLNDVRANKSSLHSAITYALLRKLTAAYKEKEKSNERKST